MTSVICKHCLRQIGSPAGLIAHIKSMHPEQRDAAREQAHMPPPSPVPDDDEVAWEEPPKRGRRSVVAELAAKVERVRTRPNTWARIKTFDGKSGASGHVKAMRDAYPDVEFQGSVVATGSALFARFVEEG